MDVHMIEPRCLTEAIDSRASFPEASLGLANGFAGVAECFVRNVPASSAGQAIIQGISLLGRQPARDLAHDRNDLLHDITAGAAGSTSQQILDRSSDLCFGVVLVYKIPIELI
jgi:hypothetical protein